MKRLLSQQSAASLLGCSRPNVAYLVSTKRLRTIKDGSTRRVLGVLACDVLKLAAERTAQAVPVDPAA